MKQHIFSLLFSILCVAFVAAQTTEVKGRIIDSNTGQVIPDTSVSIEESVFSTRSDSSGTFSISGSSLPQGEQVLVVEKNGFLTKRIPINIRVGSITNLDPIVLENDFTDFQTQIGTIILADDELDEDVSGADNIS
ncbi:MAG TPA: carboxypeptidase-like regulatory domain-containing protein, partial [Flavobacteriaceae bacterium]|nr:carboxypeptidase-like regulatory domain-containing protein [Flavobacteriaceae bacterium]